MPTALVLSMCLVTAPPPKPAANEGRITVWSGDKCEHFRPDGGDVTSVKWPDGLTVATVWALTPDRKFVVHLDRAGSTAAVTKTKLIVTPVEGDGKPFALDGYVVGQVVPSPVGSMVYFTGAKGDELETEKVRSAGAFTLDLASKKVEPFPVPEKHTLAAVAPDGKTRLTYKIDTDNNTYSRKTFLVPPDGKPIEVLKENVFTSMTSFSPDGSKVLMQAIEYTGVQPAGNGGFRVTGSKPREYLILDVATKQTRPLRDIPKEGYLNGLAWSPDGTRVAYLWYDPQTALAAAVPVPAGAPGGVIRPDYEYKVFVADADGANPKEVHKTKGIGSKFFMWK